VDAPREQAVGADRDGVSAAYTRRADFRSLKIAVFLPVRS